MIRCCLCHQVGTFERVGILEHTDLPGSGWRCRDHVGCKRRVRTVISAHKALEEVCKDVPLQP